MYFSPKDRKTSRVRSLRSNKFKINDVAQILGPLGNFREGVPGRRFALLGNVDRPCGKKIKRTQAVVLRHRR